MSLSREEIIRMAKAFAWMREGQKEMDDFLVDFFKAAYAAGAAAEREACAMVCEDSKSLIWNLSDDAIKSAGNNVCDNLAAAIRARGNGNGGVK